MCWVILSTGMGGHRDLVVQAGLGGLWLLWNTIACWCLDSHDGQCCCLYIACQAG